MTNLSSDYNGSCSSTEYEDKVILNSDMHNLILTNTVQMKLTAQGIYNTIQYDTCMSRNFVFKMEIISVNSKRKKLTIFQMIINDNFLQVISK